MNIAELAERLERDGHWVSLDYRVREKAAADILDIGQRTLRQWREEGRGPVFVAVGQRITYRLADILAWLDSRSVDPCACVGETRQFAAIPVRVNR